MSTLVLELPDKYVHVLERVASERGTSINDIVAELVDTIVLDDDLDPTYDVTHDPLFSIKAHASDAPADLSRKEM
jgi:hypothetical protein